MKHNNNYTPDPSYLDYSYVSSLIEAKLILTGAYYDCEHANETTQSALSANNDIRLLTDKLLAAIQFAQDTIAEVVDAVL